MWIFFSKVVSIEQKHLLIDKKQNRRRISLNHCQKAFENNTDKALDVSTEGDVDKKLDFLAESIKPSVLREA